MSPRRVRAGLMLALCVAGSVVWMVVARSRGDGPARCPEGLVSHGARCCGGGQSLSDGQCTGRASSCARTQELVDGRCVAKRTRIVVTAMELSVTLNDWDLEGRAPPSREPVAQFAISSAEVTNAEWAACAEAGQCRSLGDVVPELPVVDVSVEEAMTYCRFRGGSLPTSAQWLAAAAGSEGRRYPWGAFGLVCRRAVFGLVQGPCGQGGDGPEVPGSRPDGATPDGVLDLSGNVAEWTLDDASRKPVARARGGSFRSTLASELKSLGSVGVEGPQDDVGLRCVWSEAVHRSQ